MTNKSVPRPRWVCSSDPHHPGAFLKQGRKQVGRVLYSGMTRNYSCFVGELATERWLGCAVDLESAKRKVDDERAIESATAFLRGIQPQQRISLLDPRAVNLRGTWTPMFVLEGEQQTLPYNPICRNKQHTRIFMRQHLDIVGFISNLCACELANGSKQLAVWDMPADAKHVMSATGFDNGKNYEERRTWQSTTCGVLWETTGGRSWHKDGHLTYPAPVHWPEITCPGCAMREGRPPQEIEGVTVYRAS